MQVLGEQRAVEAELRAQRVELVGRGGMAEDLPRGISGERLGRREDEDRDAEQDQDAEREPLDDPERQARQVAAAEPGRLVVRG